MSHAPVPSSATTPVPPGPRRSSTDTSSVATLALLCAAQLMLVLDITAMNVALPTLGVDLGMSGGALSWAITAYVVVFGGFMLLGGRLADVLGHRRMLMVGLVVFTAGSVVCGTSGSWSWLVAGRAVQGLGAALLSPAALASLTRAFDGPARVKALGAWAGIGTVGFVAGLVLGGALTAGPGWRWIFLVNVPVAAVILLAGPRLLARDDAARRGSSLDVPGAVLVTATVALLVYGLSSAGTHGAGSAHVLVALAGAAATGVALAAVERRHAHPLMEPRVVRQGAVLRGLAVMVAASAGMLATLFLASLYAQQVLDFGPLATGLLFLPSAAATTLSAHVGARLIVRHGARVVAVAAFVVTAGGAAVLTGAPDRASVWTMLVPGLSLISLGLGPVFVAATSSTLASVQGEHAGLTAGVITTGHEVGGALGLGAIAAAVGAAVAAPPAAFAAAFGWLAAGAAAMAVLSLRIVPAVRPEHARLGHGH